MNSVGQQVAERLQVSGKVCPPRRLTRRQQRRSIAGCADARAGRGHVDHEHARSRPGRRDYNSPHELPPRRHSSGRAAVGGLRFLANFCRRDRMPQRCEHARHESRRSIGPHGRRRAAGASTTCPAWSHQDPERERATGHGVNFVEAGSFQVRTTGAWQAARSDLPVRDDARAGVLLRARRGASRGSLPLGGVLGRRGGERARGRSRWPTRPRGRSRNRLAFIQRALRSCAAGDEARIEALAGALLWSLAAASRDSPSSGPSAWPGTRPGSSAPRR